MDPIVNINRQRELAAKLIALRDSENVRHLADLDDELAELVQALDEWQRKGGFDPYAIVPRGNLHTRGL